MARRFFYVAAAVLILALAYHLGAGTTVAQAPENPVVAQVTGINGAPIGVVTANGDIYLSTSGSLAGPFALTSNVFNGGSPTSVTQQSWGQVKTRYR